MSDDLDDGCDHINDGWDALEDGCDVLNDGCDVLDDWWDDQDDGCDDLDDDDDDPDDFFVGGVCCFCWGGDAECALLSLSNMTPPRFVFINGANGVNGSVVVDAGIASSI